MQVTGQPDLSAYYQYLQNNPEETKALLGDMLIGVTNFSRDREAFEATRMKNRTANTSW